MLMRETCSKGEPTSGCGGSLFLELNYPASRRTLSGLGFVLSLEDWAYCCTLSAACAAVSSHPITDSVELCNPIGALFS